MPELPLDSIVLGDCLEVLKTFPDNSIDAIVSDPPYGLGTREPTGEDITRYLQGERLDLGGDFMGKEWDIPTVVVWKECLRVLKPGGHLLAFAGTRTWDIMSIGIRAAGFEDRDTIASYSGGVLAWMHGQGFPKSLNIAKAIDKHLGVESEVVGEGENWGKSKLEEGKTTFGDYEGTWPVTKAVSEEAKKWEGWGTALKPSWEPILVFRKPLEGTVVANVLAHGVGGLNIDESRVEGQAEVPGSRRAYRRFDDKGDAPELEPPPPAHPGGRWPTNLVLCHAPGCKVHRSSVFERISEDDPLQPAPKADEWECVDGCPVKMLDEQSGERPGGNFPSQRTPNEIYGGGHGASLEQVGGPRSMGDTGGASRFYPQFEGQEPPLAPFFYTGKATKSETTIDGQVENTHPTRKPLALMKWLVKLVTPPNGVVVDPYCGSGSTCVAAAFDGYKFIGIEREPVYHAIATKRVGIIYEERQEHDHSLDTLDFLTTVPQEGD